MIVQSKSLTLRINKSMVMSPAQDSQVDVTLFGKNYSCCVEVEWTLAQRAQKKNWQIFRFHIVFYRQPARTESPKTLFSYQLDTNLGPPIFISVLKHQVFTNLQGKCASLKKQEVCDGEFHFKISLVSIEKILQWIFFNSVGQCFSFSWIIPWHPDFVCELQSEVIK